MARKALQTIKRKCHCRNGFVNGKTCARCDGAEYVIEPAPWLSTQPRGDLPYHVEQGPSPYWDYI